jgi:Mycoplasma protein of unknown function, DUF285
MFDHVRSFNPFIGFRDVSYVRDMAGMFSGASAFIPDVGSWKSNVTKKEKHVLQATTFDQDVESCDTFPVNDMNLMLPGAGAFNQDIGTGGMSSVNYMGGMLFLIDSFNKDIIGTFDVPNVTGMFNGASHKTMRRNVSNAPTC